MKLHQRLSDMIAFSMDDVGLSSPAGCREAATSRYTHKPKINIFAPHGRLVAPIHVKFGTAKGHLGPPDSAKFHSNRCTKVGTRPKNLKFFHFLVKSRPAWTNSLTDFYSC